MAGTGASDQNAMANGQPKATQISGTAPNPAAQNNSHKSSVPLPNAFTSEQLSILRTQITAFKLLSKNSSVPPNLQSQLFSKRSPSLKQALADARRVMDRTPGAQEGESADGGEGKPEERKIRHRYETFTSPYSHLRENIGSTEHAMRSQRVLIPSIMPTGVDADRVREERRRIIYNRMMARMSELERLPANLTSWNSSDSDAPTGDDSLKLKALVEYKLLILFPKQAKLRQQVSTEVIQFDNLAMTANRSLYRRMKKQSLREARITEKLEKQQQDARKIRERKKHIDFLQAIIVHGQDIQAAAQNRKLRLQNIGRMASQHHLQVEKEEQKRIERTAKQRLQALKSNDEEAYLKLLDQAKDSRITHLLKQTNGFLKQLASSVKEQQRSAAKLYGNNSREEEQPEEEEEDDDEVAKVDYYEVAHRIKEEVKSQPSILVGGTLKEYQLKGLQWMISLYNNNLNGLLADEMGLGKTIQTISLITYLVEKKQQNGPFLVIVPLRFVSGIHWRG